MSCLRSVLDSHRVTEVFLVDNASTDGSLQLVQDLRDTRLRIVCLNRNIGLPGARNLAAGQATGQFLAFIDADSKVDTHWLEDPLSLMKSNCNVGAVQSLNLSQRNPEIITYAGLAGDGSTWKQLPKRDSAFLEPQRRILFPIGAGFVVRRDAWSKLEGFDEALFFKHDDVDFGVRLWLAGYEVICTMNSVVYHDGGSLTARREVKRLFEFYAIRDLVTVWMKNLSGITIARYVFVQIPTIIFLAVLCGRAFGVMGLLRLLGNMPEVFVKRRRVQMNRKVSDNEIMDLLQHILPLRFMVRTIRITLHYKYL